jgi:hypothetical protein
LLKKTITYENPFTDKEVTEVHYFHISKADLVEMEMEEHGFTYEKDGTTLTGMQAKLQRIVDSEDGRAIMQEVKDIIRRSYGRKDGDRFLKSPDIWENFAASEAFSQLFFELCTNAGAAAEFMNGVIPNNLEKIAADIRDQAAQAQISNGEIAPSPPVPSHPVSLEADPTAVEPIAPSDEAENQQSVVLSPREISEMDSDELKSGLATGRYRLS